MRTFDKTSSNSIDFDYFIQVCVTLHQLTDSFRRKDKNQSGRIDLNYEEVSLLLFQVLYKIFQLTRFKFVILDLFADKYFLVSVFRNGFG